MKKTRFFVLFFAVMVTCFCLVASAEVYTGRALDTNYILNSGDENYEPTADPQETDVDWLANYYRIRYELNTETGVLRIFCDPSRNPQKMLQYANANWVPWTKDHMRPYIKTVIIEEGVTTVGRFTFAYCENLETVYIPNSCMRVDQTCFYECPKLKTIYYAGSQENFETMVIYEDKRNSYTGGSTEIKALDLIQYGETITIFCRNQDGEIFTSYTVGGYNAGDAFAVTPLTFEEGITYVGTGELPSGTFKKGDTREFVLDYFCEHSYAFSDESLPCSSVCIYCGCADPAYEDEHTWDVKKDVARGLFSDRNMKKVCTVCGLERSEKAIAYIWYVAAAAAVVVIVVALCCVIIIPIRKKKKIKDMTW